MDSPWQGVYGQRFLPTPGRRSLQIRIDLAAYERLLKTAPASLHLRLALTRIKASATTSVVFPRGNIELPGFWHLLEPPGFRIWELLADENLDCRSALHQAATDVPEHGLVGRAVFLVSTHARAYRVAYGWTGDLNPESAEFGITSVWTPM